MINASDDDMQKRMMDGCMALAEVAKKLGNINLYIEVDPGDVPIVKPMLEGYDPKIAVAYDGVSAYDVWTTGRMPMPKKNGLSLDGAAKLLIEDYTSRKRKQMQRRYNVDNRQLDEYFAKMHNGFGCRS